MECEGEFGEEATVGEELETLGHAVLEEDEEVGAAVVEVVRVFVDHAWKAVGFDVLYKAEEEVC